MDKTFNKKPLKRFLIHLLIPPPPFLEQLKEISKNSSRDIAFEREYFSFTMKKIIYLPFYIVLPGNLKHQKQASTQNKLLGGIKCCMKLKLNDCKAKYIETHKEKCGKLHIY